jgi:hypothetical protein
MISVAPYVYENLKLWYWTQLELSLFAKALNKRFFQNQKFKLIFENSSCVPFGAQP